MDSQLTRGEETFNDKVISCPLFKSTINGKIIQDIEIITERSIEIKVSITDFDLYKYIDGGHIYKDNTSIRRLTNNERKVLAANYYVGWKIYINDIEETINQSNISTDGTINTLTIFDMDNSWNNFKKDTDVKIYIPNNILHGTMSSGNQIASLGRSLLDNSSLDFFKGWTIIMETNNIRQKATIRSSTPNGNRTVNITYDRGGIGSGFNLGDASSNNTTKYQLIPPKRIILSGTFLTDETTHYILSPPHNNRGLSSLSITGCSEVYKKKVTREITSIPSNKIFIDDVSELKKGMIIYKNSNTFKKYNTIRLVENEKVYGYFSDTSKQLSDLTPYYQTTDYYKGWIIETKNPTKQCIITSQNNLGVLSLNPDITTTSDTSFIIKKNVIHLSDTTINHSINDTIQFYPVNKKKVFYGVSNSNNTTSLYLNNLNGLDAKSLLVETNSKLFESGTIIERVEIEQLPSNSSLSLFTYVSQNVIELSEHGDVSNIENYFNGWIIQITGINNYYGVITAYSQSNRRATIDWDTATEPTSANFNANSRYKLYKNKFVGKITKLTNNTLRENHLRIIDISKIEPYSHGNGDTNTGRQWNQDYFKFVGWSIKIWNSTGNYYRYGHISSHDSTNPERVNVDWDGEIKTDTFQNNDEFILEKNEIILNNLITGTSPSVSELFNTVDGTLTLLNSSKRFPEGGKFREANYYVGWNINIIGASNVNEIGSGRILTHNSDGTFTIDTVISNSLNSFFILTAPELTFVNNEIILDTKSINNANLKTGSLYSSNYYNNWNIETVFPQPTLSGTSQSTSQLISGLTYTIINLGSDNGTELGNNGAGDLNIGATFTASSSVSLQNNGKVYLANSLDSQASVIDDYYNGWNITISNPTDYGIITDYNGSSKVITVSFENGNSIQNGTTYTLTRPEINDNLIGNRSGKITSYINNSDLQGHSYGIMQSELKLETNAASNNDHYNNWRIITKNPNDSGIIKDYDGTSKIISKIVSDKDIVKCSFTSSKEPGH